eukprot:6104611-Lingulodinium_polyedra.AAC.1
MSVAKRFKRVQGCATAQLHETMTIVTGSVFKIQAMLYQDYKGSATGSMIGPVVVPNPDQVWVSPWKMKTE